MKKLLTLICRQKTKFILHIFLEILQVYCFGYFGHAWMNKPKVILSTCRKASCLFPGKKSTSSPMLYWRYCKDMQTSYFGYFGHAWLHTPKTIKSTCTSLWCVSVCKKQTSSLTSFLRYYILKNPAIWLADSIKN